MRATRALEKLPEADSVSKFDDFVRGTLRTGKLAEKYTAICAEETAKVEE